MFDCTLGYYLPPPKLALQIYRAGYFFLEAFAATHDGFEAAVDVLQFGDWHFDKTRRGGYGYKDSDAEPVFDQQKRNEFEQALLKLLKKGAKR